MTNESILVRVLSGLVLVLAIPITVVTINRLLVTMNLDTVGNAPATTVTTTDKTGIATTVPGFEDLLAEPVARPTTTTTTVPKRPRRTPAPTTTSALPALSDDQPFTAEELAYLRALADASTTTLPSAPLGPPEPPTVEPTAPPLVEPNEPVPVVPEGGGLSPEEQAYLAALAAATSTTTTTEPPPPDPVASWWENLFQPNPGG